MEFEKLSIVQVLRNGELYFDPMSRPDVREDVADFDILELVGYSLFEGGSCLSRSVPLGQFDIWPAGDAVILQ